MSAPLDLCEWIYAPVGCHWRASKCFRRAHQPRCQLAPILAWDIPRKCSKSCFKCEGVQLKTTPEDRAEISKDRAVTLRRFCK